MPVSAHGRCGARDARLIQGLNKSRERKTPLFPLKARDLLAKAT